MPLLGRLEMLARNHPQLVGNGGTWTLPDMPFGASEALVSVTSQDVAVGIAFLDLFHGDPNLDGDAFGTGTNMLDTRIDQALDVLVNAQVMDAGDKAALQAMSQNRRSYAQDRGYPELKPGDIEYARSIP